MCAIVVLIRASRKSHRLPNGENYARSVDSRAEQIGEDLESDRIMSR